MSLIQGFKENLNIPNNEINEMYLINSSSHCVTNITSDLTNYNKK